jgi:ADP-heptose:LPS heptosyltransferase
MARVLIIQLSRLGDVIQTTPLLKDWLAGRPGDRIDVLLFDQHRRVLDGLDGLHEVKGLPSVSRYQEIEAELLAGLKHNAIPAAATDLLRSLDLPHYAQIVNLTYDFLTCWIAGRLRCDKRSGGYVNARGEWLYGGLVHVYLAALPDFRDLNWLNLVDLWRSAAPASPVPAGSARPHVSVAAELPFGLPEGARIALNPGSSSEDRRWPPAHFARLAEHLHGKGFIPVLVGAAGDRVACDEVQAECRIPLDNFCGRTDIPQMARMLAAARLLVSVDTGAVHIASCTGTPVVGLYGATASFRETAPWGEGHLILQAPLETELARLPPDLVLGACLTRLGILEEAEWRRDLEIHRATAWETLFLPQDSDPLGGLGYRPVHRPAPQAADLFTRSLRHLFAADFLRSEVEVSLSYMESWHSSPPSQPSLLADLQALAAAVEAAAAQLDRMAGMASEAAALSRAGTAKAAERIQATATELIEALEGLKVAAANSPAGVLQPVIRYLDWDFRMMPMLAPVETFRYHQRRYARAAATLRQAYAAAERHRTGV